uniref:Uncharacterized protein n=1 Tax=Plectus sambesii TaxID=2011161 RepID=A0A914VU84_9BILA
MASSGSPPSRGTPVVAHQLSSVDPNDLTGDCWKLTLMDFRARLGTAPQQLRSGELLLLLIGLLAVSTPLADALLPPFAVFAAFRLLPAVAFVSHSANVKIRSLLVTCTFIDIALTIVAHGVGLADLVLAGWPSLLAPLPILFFIVYQEQHSLSAVVGVVVLRTFAKRALLLPLLLRPFVGYIIAVLGLMSAASAAPAQRDRSRQASNGPSIAVDSNRRLSGLTPSGRKSTDSAPSPVASTGNRASFDRGPPPPAASSRFGSLTDTELHRGFAAATRNRRTSLPASAGHLLINRAQSNVSEARGLIADMLANRDLPGNVISCLRAVASLLNPQQAATVNLHMDLGLPRVVENPYSGEQLVVSGVSKLL